MRKASYRDWGSDNGIRADDGCANGKSLGTKGKNFRLATTIDSQFLKIWDNRWGITH